MSNYLHLNLSDDEFERLQTVLHAQRLSYKQFLQRCLTKFDDDGYVKYGKKRKREVSAK